MVSTIINHPSKYPSFIPQGILHHSTEVLGFLYLDDCEEFDEKIVPHKGMLIASIEMLSNNRESHSFILSKCRIWRTLTLSILQSFLEVLFHIQVL